jgi:hypothetical protein
MAQLREWFSGRRPCDQNGGFALSSVKLACGFHAPAIGPRGSRNEKRAPRHAAAKRAFGLARCTGGRNPGSPAIGRVSRYTSDSTLRLERFRGRPH